MASQTGVNVIWAHGAAIKGVPNEGPKPILGTPFEARNG